MLNECSAEILDERNSRKQPMSDEEAKELIESVSVVWVAKGRKIVEIPSNEASPDDLKGRSGNVRAPMIRKGDQLLVGFHVDTLQSLLGS